MHPSRDEIDDIAVIGAGAAGLLAGIAAARTGARVSVYERNSKPGRKIAISGGGRCNFSNTLPPREFVRRFGDPNAKRLGRALSEFTSEAIVGMLARRGVRAAVEHGWRLYAASEHGEDVVEALLAELRDAGARLVTSAKVSAVDWDRLAGVFTIVAGGAPNTAPHEESETRNVNARPATDRSGGKSIRRALCVVICTGGLSYPETGSTGDGYEWAKRFGHRVSDLKAGLVGLKTAETWPADLQGLSWPDATAILTPSRPQAEGIEGGKSAEGRASVEGSGREPRSARGAGVAIERGEIIFTHFGISGPAVLDLSNAFAAMGNSSALLSLDFFPNICRENLDALLLRRFSDTPGRLLASAIEGMMPRRMAEKAAELSGAGDGSPVCRLPRERRMALLDFLKGARLTVTGTRGIERGEVTCGGISWDDLDASTLESRIRPGLFFAGEILDVSGRCGGFNMQAAFSTGWLAGKSAAERAIRLRMPQSSL